MQNPFYKTVTDGHPFETITNRRVPTPLEALDKNNNQKFLEVQEPFSKKVPGHGLFFSGHPLGSAINPHAVRRKEPLA